MRETKTVCFINEDGKMSSENQKLYHSGVGMLFYLVKHSHPDIAKAAREISKGLYGANMAAYKEKHHVIKFVLDTSDLGLHIQPIHGREQPWELICFTDSLALYFMFVVNQSGGDPRLNTV